MTNISEEQRSEGEAIDERIAQRAFELFLARGMTHGHDLDDWLRAEQEVRATKSEMSAAA